MKFHVPNYSCLQNAWLGGYCPQIPVLAVLCAQLNLLNPPPEQNSWVCECYGGTVVRTIMKIWRSWNTRNCLTGWVRCKQVFKEGCAPWSQFTVRNSTTPFGCSVHVLLWRCPHPTLCRDARRPVTLCGVQMQTALFADTTVGAVKPHNGPH
jgi:hypothetical protein